jgi:hypothetical protein
LWLPWGSWIKDVGDLDAARLPLSQLERLADALEQFSDLEGLIQGPNRSTQPRGFQEIARRHLPTTRYGDDGKVRTERVELPNHLETVHLGHVDVGDDEVALFFVPESQRLQPTQGLADPVARPLQDGTDCSAYAVFVVDHEDAFHLCAQALQENTLTPRPAALGCRKILH